MGRMTASFSASLAPLRPATSDHLTFGFSMTMAPSSWFISFFFSLSSLPSLLSESSPSESFSLSLAAPPLSFTGLSFLVFPLLMYSFSFSARSR